MSMTSLQQQQTQPQRTTDRLQDVFEDLMSRFIINVPDQEIATTERICFQIEQAHWYYLDFLRELEPSLPGFTLKRFAAEMFQRCPLLRNFLVDSDVEEIYQRFVAYKMNVPVCGSIILNERMDKVLLVRGWSQRSTWTFPKGKINQDESDVHCAIRETLEEIGFDISSLIKAEDHIELVLRGEQRNRLYIVPGIAETTEFQTRTRKEIGDIKWHRIVDLPRFSKKQSQQQSESDAKFYMIKRFMNEIIKWIAKYKKSTNGKKASGRSRNKSVDSMNTTETMLSSSPQSFVDHSENLKSILGITPSKSSLTTGKFDDASLHNYSASSRPSTVSTLQEMHTPLDAQASLLSILNKGESQQPLPQSISSSVPISRPSTASILGYHESVYGSTPPASLGTQLSNHNMELLSILKGKTVQSHASVSSFPATALSPIANHQTNFVMAPPPTVTSSVPVPIPRGNIKPLTPSSIIQSQSNNVNNQNTLLKTLIGTPPANYTIASNSVTPSNTASWIKPVELLTPSHVSTLKYSRSEPLMPNFDNQQKADPTTVSGSKQKRKSKKQRSTNVVETASKQQNQTKQQSRPATASSSAENQEGNLKKKTILKKSQSGSINTEDSSNSKSEGTGVTPAKKKITILKRQETAPPAMASSSTITNGTIVPSKPKTETKDVEMTDSTRNKPVSTTAIGEANGDSRKSSMSEFKFNISDIMKMFSK